jgi:hypothetical protein
MRSRVARLLLVSRCSALRGPTSDHLLWRLLTSAVSRNASLQDALRGLMGRCRFARSETGQHDLNARSFAVRHNLGRSCPSAPHRPGAQISPGKDANCRCTSAAFTVGRVPLGFAVMCQLASQPSALTMRFLSVASHLLHSGFLRTCPRGIALAFGSWLSLLMMSPSRYLHRGLPPHKFAPTLGAHTHFEPTRLRRAPEPQR